MIKEAIEIDKFPENVNKEDGWKISNVWKPIIHQAKKCQERKQPIKINIQQELVTSKNNNQKNVSTNELGKKYQKNIKK